MKKRQGKWSRREMVICLAAYASLKPVDRNSPPLPLIHILTEKLPLRDVGTIKLRFSNFVNKDPEMRELGKKVCMAEVPMCKICGMNFPMKMGK